MDDGERRCALPGCGRTITTTAGRPERRYCTAAHRAAARRARRAAVPAEQPDGPDVLADALPWLRDAIGTGAPRAGDPGAEPVRPRRQAETAPAPEVSSESHDRRPMPRRRHALALLGVAGILAGGYAVTDAQPEPTPVQAAPEGAPAPDEAAADTWAQRATVALASVNRQLDTLAQTEDEWRRLPESGRAVVPGPVAALEERRSVLQRRRATLQAQLDDYRSLRRTQQELANSEQHLRAVETALADAPPRRRRSAEQDAAIAALEEQRDLRIRRRDVQRTELASLQDGVSTATRTPLPDDGAATARITDDVMEMVHNGGTQPGRPDPKPPRPEVVAGRESEDGKPRQEVGTSGPPDPRGPRDESDERRAAKEKRAAEAVGGKTRTAEGQASPSRGKDDPAQRRDPSEKPRDDRKPAERDSSAGTDPGNEKSADKPAEAHVVDDAGKSRDRQKDRESPDKDAAESRAHYRQAEERESTQRKSSNKNAMEDRAHYRRTEIREPAERKPASTDIAERGSQYRHADRSASTDRESAKMDPAASASTYHGSKDRNGTQSRSKYGEAERDSEKRDSRQHGEVKKRESTDCESEHRDSTSRKKDRDSKDRDSKGRRSTEHGSTKGELSRRRAAPAPQR